MALAQGPVLFFVVLFLISLHNYEKRKKSRKRMDAFFVGMRKSKFIFENRKELVLILKE